MKYSSQKIKGRKVEFKEITGLDEIDNCYLIYICKGEGDFTKQILSYTSNKPILTISDDEELSSKGVLITLFVQNEHMFFQVNKSAVQQSGLYFSSLLLSLSKNINTEEN